MTKHLAARLAAPFVLAAMLSGCALATRNPSIAELKYNPGRYNDRNVAIDGVVTSSWGRAARAVQDVQGERRYR